MSSREKQPTASRTVMFFRGHSGFDENGAPRAFPARVALSEISQLPFTSDGRYLREDADIDVCAWPDGVSSSPYQVRLASIRRGDLPRLEQDGQLRELPIPSDAGLAEEVHYVFFPHNIVGALFNFYGPRPTKIVEYIAKRCSPPHNQLELDPLLRQDATQRIQRMEEIRLVDIEVRRTAEGVIKDEDDDLFQAIRAARKLSDADRIRLLLRPEPYSRSGLGSRILALVKKLAGMHQLPEIATRFVVKGYDNSIGSMVDIDVLRTQFVSREEVVLQDQRTRALDQGSAYAAVVRAHSQMFAELRAAASVSLLAK